MEIRLSRQGGQRMTPLRDVQDDAPLGACGRCHQEIYRYDPVGDVAGALLHVDCMTREEQEDCRIAPAASFFVEAC